MTPDLNPLEVLWESTTRIDRSLAPARLASLPEAARRYVEHAVGPGTALATSVRLRMHGEIKLGRWWPFRAEEVIHGNRGMVWHAIVRMWGLSVCGSDLLIDGEGRMQWNLLGCLPLVRAKGLDIVRSAAGRLAAESVWLPSTLAAEDVSWTALDTARAQAQFAVSGYPASLELTVTAAGQLRRLALARWGNPDGGPFRPVPFGALVEDEARFGDYTIPTRLRVGWHIGTEGFESEGEFFRATVDEATYR
jgi:hypothetical protein